ncbi:hypothetical protein E1211_11230 [Micromonospora sp. 15K316]|nr:hypothetical protein E1211_11230 [Micromonospora sp. 15K316]
MEAGSLDDTTDVEWRILAPHVPAGTGWGRPITYPGRDVVDAIRYRDRLPMGGTARRRPASQARRPGESTSSATLP